MTNNQTGYNLAIFALAGVLSVYSIKGTVAAYRQFNDAENRVAVAEQKAGYSLKVKSCLNGAIYNLEQAESTLLYRPGEVHESVFGPNEVTYPQDPNPKRAASYIDRIVTNDCGMSVTDQKTIDSTLSAIKSDFEKNPSITDEEGNKKLFAPEIEKIRKIKKMYKQQQFYFNRQLNSVYEKEGRELVGSGGLLFVNFLIALGSIFATIYHALEIKDEL